MPTNPNMVAIQTVTVGAGGASSIDFTIIPQTYTDLCVKFSIRTDRAATQTDLVVRFNNSTSNLSSRDLLGSGSGVSSSAYASEGYIIVAPSANATANTFGNGEIYVPNYTSSNNKSVSADVVAENNSTTAYSGLSAVLWSNSAAITSLKIQASTGNLVQYSTATLYGVTSAGYGAKATGGIITETATHYIHTFLSSGTFTPTVNMTAEYLVIAGGGGSSTGGGGAGGYRCSVTGENSGGGASAESALSLTASTNYTVTVGGGGAVNTQGSNSVFSSITSTGGGKGDGLNINGGTGGSGGGGGQGTTTGGAGTANQGYAGGNGATNAGGGGGGASAAATNATSGVGGNGGNGVSSSITGTSVTRAGGGGGAGTSSGGTAGTGGGGSGSATSGTAGTPNTGGGGGAGWSVLSTAGGSGIVIVRYAK